ncbi:hypothetical protein D9M70_555400 [compost metagenome]
MGDEVFDAVQLALEIRLVLHADGFELVVAPLLCMRLCAFEHVLEEVVGKRLHDEANDGFVGGHRDRRERSGNSERDDRCES